MQDMSAIISKFIPTVPIMTNQTFTTFTFGIRLLGTNTNYQLRAEKKNEKVYIKQNRLCLSKPIHVKATVMINALFIYFQGP